MAVMWCRCREERRNEDQDSLDSPQRPEDPARGCAVEHRPGAVLVDGANDPPYRGWIEQQTEEAHVDIAAAQHREAPHHPVNVERPQRDQCIQTHGEGRG